MQQLCGHIIGMYRRSGEKGKGGGVGKGGKGKGRK